MLTQQVDILHWYLHHHSKCWSQPLAIVCFDILRLSVIISPPEETKRETQSNFRDKIQWLKKVVCRALLVGICALLFFIWDERHAFHFAYQRQCVWCSGYSEIFTCDAWKTVSLDSPPLSTASSPSLVWSPSFLFSLSHSVPSTSFLLKRILYHVCHHHGLYCTPITSFVVRPLQACENDNDLLFNWDWKHVQRMRRAACGSGCPSCRLHRMKSQGQCLINWKDVHINSMNMHRLTWHLIYIHSFKLQSASQVCKWHHYNIYFPILYSHLVSPSAESLDDTVEPHC